MNRLLLILLLAIAALPTWAGSFSTGDLPTVDPGSDLEQGLIADIATAPSTRSGFFTQEDAEQQPNQSTATFFDDLAPLGMSAAALAGPAPEPASFFLAATALAALLFLTRHRKVRIHQLPISVDRSHRDEPRSLRTAKP